MATSSKLDIGFSTPFTTLDPTSPSATPGTEQVIDGNVLQHLVGITPKGTLVPVLATSWQVSPDRKTYTFTLRPGVTFSNGDPLTADDVVFSINRARAADSTYPQRSLFNVASVDKLDSSHVAVTLTQPSYEWLFNLAGYSIGVIVDPNAVNSLSTKPIGTGPFTVSSQTPGSAVTLTRNMHYWGAAPPLQQATFHYFADPTAEMSALTKGQIQVLDGLAPSQRPGSFGSGYTVITGPANNKVEVTLNNNLKPFDDMHIRQAFADAINRSAITDSMLAGSTVPLISDTVPGDPYYSATLHDDQAYNTGVARQLLQQGLQEEGLTLGTLPRLTLTVPPDAYLQSIAALVVQDWSSVLGVPVATQPVSAAQWQGQITGGPFNLTIGADTQPRDLLNFANPQYFGHFSNPAVTTALQQAEGAPTQAGWIQFDQMALQQINTLAPTIFLFTLAQVTVAKAGVVGLPTTGYAPSFDLSDVQIGGSVPAAVAAEGYTSK